MKAAVLIFFGLLAATAAVTLLILYLRYASSPAAQWKKRIRAAVSEQEGRLRAARRALADLDRDSDDRGLREEFFDRHLRGLAVEELARYPGIGPATVSRLRDARLATVGACARARLSAIPGIGPARQADLRDALRKVRREAESRFEAGACREAVAFADERRRRQAERDRRRREAAAETRAAEAALAGLRDQAQAADGITFVGHLFKHDLHALADEILDRDPANDRQKKPAAVPVGKLEPEVRRPMPPPLPGPAPRPLERPLTPTPEVGSGPLPDWITDAPTTELVRPPVATHPPVPPRRIAAEPEAVPRAETLVGTVSQPVPTGSEPCPTSPGGSLADVSGSAEPPPPPEASPFARLRAVAGLGLAVAKADGRIAAAERKQVRAFLERRYATGPELSRTVESLLAEVEADLPTLGDALWELKRSIPPDAWPGLYQFAVSVADAAGERNTREVECLARVAEELGIGTKPPPAHVPAPVVATEPDAPLTEPECRAALEIAPELPLSVDLIRRHHRLLSDRFAPEKFASHGPEFVQMAADKRDKAERAARHLLAGYNEPLEPPAAPPPPADLRHNPDLDDVFGA
jgi:uncharacterized tellurite resistance protein B-like protein